MGIVVPTNDHIPPERTTRMGTRREVWGITRAIESGLLKCFQGHLKCHSPWAPPSPREDTGQSRSHKPSRDTPTPMFFALGMFGDVLGYIRGIGVVLGALKFGVGLCKD